MERKKNFHLLGIHFNWNEIWALRLKFMNVTGFMAKLEKLLNSTQI